jgi:hypothetical protein
MEMEMSAYFFFFLKCPPLFIKLHSSHDEIRRGPSHPLQVFQSHVSFYGARYSRLLGKDKGHSASRHWRLHSSGMALSSETKTGAYRKRVLLFEEHHSL